MRDWLPASGDRHRTVIAVSIAVHAPCPSVTGTRDVTSSRRRRHSCAESHHGCWSHGRGMFVSCSVARAGGYSGVVDAPPTHAAGLPCVTGAAHRGHTHTPTIRASCIETSDPTRQGPSQEPPTTHRCVSSPRRPANVECGLWTHPGPEGSGVWALGSSRGVHASNLSTIRGVWPSTGRLPALPDPHDALPAPRHPAGLPERRACGRGHQLPGAGPERRPPRGTGAGVLPRLRRRHAR